MFRSLDKVILCLLNLIIKTKQKSKTKLDLLFCLDFGRPGFKEQWGNHFWGVGETQPLSGIALHQKEAEKSWGGVRGKRARRRQYMRGSLSNSRRSEISSQD